MKFLDDGLISGLLPLSSLTFASAVPLAKLSLSKPQRPLGSAAVTAMPAIMTLSSSSFHSSGEKLVLSAISVLLEVFASRFMTSST